MFRNYFKIGFRNLWKNKGYSFINIFGLAVGMAVAMLIGLWVQYETGFDSFNANNKRIGAIKKRTFFNNEKNVQDGIMLPLYDELKANYPEVKHITRLDWGDNRSLKIGDTKLTKRGHFADPDFLKMFSFPLLKGDKNKVLNDPYSIVLTESTATALFGKESAVGKTINIDNRFNVIVSGVLKDIPKNSSLQFDYLLPYELNIATNEFVKNSKDQWQNNFLRNYVELNEGVSMDAFSKRIELVSREKSKDKNEGTLFIHPMNKWHLYSDFKNWVNTGGKIEYVRLFSIVGLLVLIIACINFMNLSTARSEKRAREVGIRKAIGSERRQLITQFLGESLLTTFLAFIISLLIVKLSLPFLSDLGFENINLDLTNFSLLGIGLIGCVFTGLLAGSYPAIYLSGFSAVKVLKGTFQVGKSANLPRKILVVTQFSFSIALIIATVIVFQQIQYAKDRPLGYNPDKLLDFSLSEDLEKNYDVFKQDLLATGYVEAVSKSSSPMTGVYNSWDDFSWTGKDPSSHPIFSAIMVSHDYDKAAGLTLKEGRFFSKDFPGDSSSVLINDASVKLMGYKDPVGKTMKLGDETVNIIGVVQDVVMEDPFRPVMPSVIIFRNYFISRGLLRLKQTADMKTSIAAIKPIFEKHNPAYTFNFNFVDEAFNKKFKTENEVGKLSGIFSVLTVFISCLGLFGLAAFMAERRIKEIGVRKVLGASVSQLWLLLSKDFLLLVIISCVIATPIAFYFISNWLQDYDYRVPISPFVFIGAAAIAMIITIITISFQAIRAAIANPVKSLRME